MNSKIWMAPIFLAAGIALASCGTSSSSSSSAPLVPASQNPTPRPASTRIVPTAADGYEACYPSTPNGNCYNPGQQCKTTQHRMTGVGTRGRVITCSKVNGVWKWEQS